MCVRASKNDMAKKIIGLQVKKKNGKLQAFKADKLIRSMVRSGSTKKLAKKIASKVKLKAYDRISTLAIRRMVIKLLGKNLGNSYRKKMRK